MFIWWIGDHLPRHVHVFDKNGKLITRVNLETSLEQGKAPLGESCWRRDYARH